MIHGMQSSYVSLGTGESESLIADQSKGLTQLVTEGLEDSWRAPGLQSM